MKTYKNHPNVVTRKKDLLQNSLSFDLPPASKKDLDKIVKSLNANKATEPDGIPLKLIKCSADVVGKYFISIRNHDILRYYFSDGAKNALVRPICKIRKIEVQ